MIVNTIIKASGGSGGSFIVVTTNRRLATLTCGSQSYTLTGTELSHAFAVSAGTYSCTVSLSGYTTVSGSVTVTTDNVYNLTLNISSLPSTYQEVEYIEGSGTQYINTGLTTTATNSVDCKFNLTSGTSQAHQQLCGAYSSTASLFSLIISGTAQRIGGNFQSGYQYTTITVGLGTDYILVASAITGDVTLNGTTETLSVGTATASGTFYLFYAGTTNRAMNGKIYYFKIYDDGVLVRDYIPCYRISDSVAGMYDLVNNIFYTNAGTGSFVVGPDVN